MDEAAVREHAQAHGDAVVNGDLRRAAQDLGDEAKAKAPAVMGKLPQPVTGASVESVEAAGDQFVALIRYSGKETSATVESRWADLDGRPTIVDLEVV